MAERGGQLGNQNATKNRPWRAAIDRALEKKSRVDQIDALRIEELPSHIPKSAI